MDPIAWIIGILFAVAGTIWHRYSLGRLLGHTPAMPDSPDDSAIISYYSAGHLMTPGSKGKLNGLRFTMFLTVPINLEASYTDEIAAICMLDLPFNTQTHLLGLSKDHKIDHVKFANFLRANGMEKVELEGDFGNYFDLYTAKGQEIQVRQVLNPEAMGFVVDYCRSHFWEINSSELYIAITEADSPNDQMLRDSQQFVEQIKPALVPGEPGAAAVHHAVPYGEYDGPELPCPICSKPMTIHDDAWLACPDGHGILINARDILRLRHHELTIPADISKDTAHGTITCPNCHHQMTLVNYQDTGVQIDSCENCPFRWLDAKEIAQIASKA